jgi:hypothetical protein
MEYFSLTTDIWSSRVMQSYLALTLHYLTDDFEMKTCVLEVKPLIGSHTAESIKSTLMASMDSFGLNTGKLSLLLRDNASNRVKACNNMDINHFGCIGHGLHLVVGPFFIWKKKRHQTDHVMEDHESNCNNGATNDEDEDDTAEYQDLDDDEEERNPDVMVAEAFGIVAKLRTIAKYVKNSSKAKEKRMQFGGRPNNKGDTVSIQLDVRTRWNSALDIFESMLRLKGAFVTFLQYLRTSERKKEFYRQTHPQVSEEEWIFIE